MRAQWLFSTLTRPFPVQRGKKKEGGGGQVEKVRKSFLLERCVRFLFQKMLTWACAQEGGVGRITRAMAAASVGGVGVGQVGSRRAAP
jgi:hypothetical protein